MKHKNYRTTFIKYIPALSSGFCLTASFPGTEFSLLAFAALVPLLISARNLTVKEAVLAGAIAGFIHFTTLIYWIIPTLNRFGGLHPVLAGLVLTALCGYLSVYPAVFMLGYKKAGESGYGSAFFSACLWTGLEYIRTYAFTGFAWGAIGYSQYPNLPLIQIADLTGVYGVSFVIVLVNACLADILKAPRKKSMACLVPAGWALTALAVTLGYGIYSLNQLDQKIANAPTSRIGIVQGNILQDLKWDDQYRTQTLDTYTKLSLNLKEKTPDLVVWPETALPFYYGANPSLSAVVDRCIREMKTNFLIGSPAFERSPPKIKFYNRAYMLNRFSIETGRYDKHHLVPFGEYVPFGKYLTFLGKIIAQAGDFTAGTASFIPLAFNEHHTGVLICFEILFPDIAAEFIKNGADFLTTITNDAWFGYTSAPRQHFSIAVFRAVENRRALIRAANTGISGFISPTGEILAETDLFTKAAFVHDLPVMTEATFYTRCTDLFSWGAMVAFFLGFMIKRLQPGIA